MLLAENLLRLRLNFSANYTIIDLVPAKKSSLGPNLIYRGSGLSNFTVYIDMLIEKSNGKILEINISQGPDSVYTKKLINSAIKYCPNLERLIIEVEFENLGDIKEIC